MKSVCRLLHLEHDAGMSATTTMVPVHETELCIEERGLATGLPLIVLHGGPGLDRHEFADYLDPLGELCRLVLVDQREQGASARGTDPATWTLSQLASDVSAIAAACGWERYAVLGHSYGAFVALQHAADAPGAAVATIVSGGVPSSRFLAGVEKELATFQPESLRQQVADSWAREATVQTAEQAAQLLHDQLPFHFADPLDPRIADYAERTSATVYSPAVLRHASLEGGGLAIEVEDALPLVHQPVLVLTGRHDRVCTVAAAQRIAELVPGAELHVFEQSGHMTFVEQPQEYVFVVRAFLARL